MVAEKIVLTEVGDLFIKGAVEDFFACMYNLDD